MNPQELIANYEAKVQNFFRRPEITTTDFQEPEEQVEQEENNNETDSDCIERGSNNEE